MNRTPIYAHYHCYRYEQTGSHIIKGRYKKNIGTAATNNIDSSIRGVAYAWLSSPETDPIYQAANFLQQEQKKR